MFLEHTVYLNRARMTQMYTNLVLRFEYELNNMYDVCKWIYLEQMESYMHI